MNQSLFPSVNRVPIPIRPTRTTAPWATRPGEETKTTASFPLLLQQH